MTKDEIKIGVLSVKNVNNIPGIMHITAEILTKGNGPFLSEINPKIGPININNL